MGGIDEGARAEVRQPVRVEFRFDEPERRVTEFVRARVRAGVPLESPGALEEEVNGGEFRNHEVEVYVEALLNDLRRDEDGARGTAHVLLRAVFAFDLRAGLAEG